MPNIMDCLKQNLPKFRKVKGLSQEELANAIGAARGTIANYERGKGGATIETISKLAQVLNVDETDLVAPPRDESGPYKRLYELQIDNEKLRQEITKLKEFINNHRADGTG